MYIDNLTIAAMIVFAVVTLAIIWFCMVKVCGLVNNNTDEDSVGSASGKHV